MKDMTFDDLVALIDEELAAQIAIGRLGEVDPPAFAVHQVASLVADVVQRAYGGFTMAEATDQIFQHLDADPGLTTARQQIETAIAKAVDGAPKQWGLLEHVLTEFEPAVVSAVISACAHAFGVVEPPTNPPLARSGDINER